LHLIGGSGSFILGALSVHGIDAGKVQYFSRPSDAARAEDISVLALGGVPPLVVPGLRFEIGAHSRCAGIVLLERVEAAELAAALANVPDPAVPIADFGGNNTLRRDSSARRWMNQALRT
jgi:hypothetical protein